MIEKPNAPPGAHFVYSDINFILLGELVHRLSGQMLNDYAREHVFLPLGMRETQFLPPAAWIPRIAPTERDGPHGAPLRGVVHDPTARYMGGVAGHAGLFSTADDLARFCEMMLDKANSTSRACSARSRWRSSPRPRAPADQPILRGLGWDIDSPFSGNRGESVPDRFLWPHRVHRHIDLDRSRQRHVRDPAGEQRASAAAAGHHGLRGKVATITAAALGIDAPGVALTGYNETINGAGLRREVERNAPTLTGLDVLAAEGFRR